MKENIDFVFLYVDGQDPNHQKKKNKYFKNTKDNIDFNPNVRYENIGEIKYSVNSIIKNLSWINKIYIITDEQIPPINQELIKSGKVIIIDHKQIIPQKYLPTFYSDVIESYIHNIPGLSEIFLYGNDDCFCLRKMKYEDFLNDDKLIIYSTFLSIHVLKILSNVNEYFSRIYKTALLLKCEKKNINDNFIFSHQIKIFRKQTLKIIEKKFKKKLNILRKNKYRNKNTINYHFLAMNYEKYINNNIFIQLNFFNSLITVNDTTFKLLFDLYNNDFIDINFLKKKFVCFNSISFKNKYIFVTLMKKIKLT